MNLSLFVWQGEGVLQDWSSGMIIALAENVEQARQLVRERFNKERGYPPDHKYWNDLMNQGLELEPEILPVESSAFYCQGGA